jgi:hypothetical protein
METTEQVVLAPASLDDQVAVHEEAHVHVDTPTPRIEAPQPSAEHDWYAREDDAAPHAELGLVRSEYS